MTRAALDPATFPELLRRRSLDEPHETAFDFLGDAGSNEQTLSYAELDARARAIAAALQERGPGGERALLVCPPGIEFIAALFGTLYAGWIAVPAYPPTRNQQFAHLRSIVHDARPAVALTTDSVLARVRSDSSLQGIKWLATEAIAAESAAAWHEPQLDPEALAVLQYTSGSTGAPRGVMLSHANVLHNTRQIERRFEIDRASRGVIWLPPFHDMGLIGGIFQGVLGGFPISLMSPTAFLRRPARWLEAISSRKATISGGPNFAYDLCVERIAPEQRANLDLTSWEVAFTGAEPVRAATLDRFASAFALSGFRAEAFYPCYGLAEATLMVTGGEKSAAPSVLNLDSRTDDTRVVSCGWVIDGGEVAIVDPASQTRCADGVVGEIWVRGPSVARGYWQQPELSRQTFQAELSGADEPYLRTGDFGLVDAGELYVTGRLKAVLNVGGRNLYAEDVEQTVAISHADGWPGGVAAISIDEASRERLVIVQEVTTRKAPELDRIVRVIRLRIAEQYEVPVSTVVLTRPGKIPRTTSGKLRRHACREALLDGSLQVLFEWRLGGRP